MSTTYFGSPWQVPWTGGVLEETMTRCDDRPGVCEIDDSELGWIPARFHPIR